jgi:nitrilase
MLPVAAVQCGSILFDTAATLERAAALIRRAASGGARLIVLPEALLGGYPKGLDFGVTVGARSDAGRVDFGRYFDAAIDVPGPETAALSELARELDVALVAGAIERGGRTLYCSALLFGPDGSPPAVHRKLMPTAAERFLWGMGDGSTLPTLDFAGARIGSAICWENYMPLFRAAMYDKGVTVWCAPTVDHRDGWLATMRHIALEGRCFVISACQYLERGDLPDDVHPLQEPGKPLIEGGSVIVSPLGQVLAGPLRDEEGIVAAALDLGDLSRAVMDFDVHGHYARPDVFTLHVDERPKPAVTTDR